MTERTGHNLIHVHRLILRHIFTKCSFMATAFSRHRDLITVRNPFHLLPHLLPVSLLLPCLVQFSLPGTLRLHILSLVRYHLRLLPLNTLHLTRCLHRVRLHKPVNLLLIHSPVIQVRHRTSHRHLVIKHLLFSLIVLTRRNSFNPLRSRTDLASLFCRRNFIHRSNLFRSNRLRNRRFYRSRRFSNRSAFRLHTSNSFPRSKPFLSLCNAPFAFLLSLHLFVGGRTCTKLSILRLLHLLFHIPYHGTDSLHSQLLITFRLFNQSIPCRTRVSRFIDRRTRFLIHRNFISLWLCRFSCS
ncbi:hypothetical protein EVA_06151 [gut metagenome]|uniref:Uncharacterized protein n=1 Tax=gut metagenome TaxID=749906 RepID=J9CZP2_9ZZZZ